MVRFLELLVLCSVLTSTCKAGYFEERDVTTEATYEAVLDKWRIVEEKMESGMESLVKRILPILIRTSSEVDISPECQGSILKMILGLRQFKPWALQMVDASGKLPSGFLLGTSSVLGNFDQCIDIAEYDEFDKKKLYTQGKYCTVEIRFPLPKRTKFHPQVLLMPPLQNYTTNNYAIKVLLKTVHAAYYLAYRIGVCLPSQCVEADLKSIAKYVVDQAGLNVDVPRCELKEELKIDGGQIAVICVIGLFVLLCFVGTALEILPGYMRKENKEAESSNQSMVKKVLTSFSVERSVHRLLHVDKTKYVEMHCLHGIRFFSITWIILGHTYTLVNQQLVKSLARTEELVDNVPVQVIANALVSVDTFFFISGLLMSNLCVKYVDSQGGKGFNVPVILLHRVWRLLPSTMIMVGLVLLIPLISSGPIWHEMTDTFTENCRSKWWTELLFINNFVPPRKMCLPHSWYTAADTQLYLISIVYLIILFRNVKLAVAFNVFLIIFSIVSTAAINYWKGFPPTAIVSDALDLFEFVEYAHSKPHVHLQVYCVGLFLGTYLARKEKTKLSKIKQLVFWCVAIICNMTVVYSAYDWNQGKLPSLAVSAIYAGLHRLAWSFGLTWVTFACINGNGGIVNRILSWSGFIPLSRLTFLAYLWHYPIILVYFATWRSGVDLLHFFGVWIYLSAVVVTFGASTISYVLYEAPIVQLERVFLEYVFKSKLKTDSEKENGITLKTAKTIEEMQMPNGELNLNGESHRL